MNVKLAPADGKKITGVEIQEYTVDEAGNEILVGKAQLAGTSTSYWPDRIVARASTRA